ncbi:hypothetical protein HYH02_006059 [Chlamydomonas schloesseri]|uniref:Dienelactone hydrolase domain-containing protein n=1 Tax=Chlamydomonas schloesseri TaxID=2026947 RepID=A0A836B6B9_9CHLO|nr:hypothetical protein HYH02_006059 [Chlamydomonas schloesseri]|eukprot:KAG2448703.1 hypothetical protein HYH02_006059 [Chlamydomonas schloesseri]
MAVQQDNALRAVTFGPSRLPGFEVGPAHAPAVLLLQEWWGVTDVVKQQARLLAAAGPAAAGGFRVLVPDLYKGTVGVDMEEAGHLMTSLDFRRAVEEVRQAAQYLLGSGSPRVGITGGCMGGALSFAAAEHVGDLLACAVPFYGTPAREMGDWVMPERIRIPLQYHTGELDPIRGFSDAQSGRELLTRMFEAGCPVELHLYPRTPHSFLNAVTPEGVDFLRKWQYGVPPPEQVELAWQRMVGFLMQHLVVPEAK